MLSKMGVFMARQELTAVYNAFDTNKDGQIQYEEFIGTLRVRFLFTSALINLFILDRYKWKEVSRCETCMAILERYQCKKRSTTEATKAILSLSTS